MRQAQTLLVAGWLVAGWLAAGWLVIGAAFAADGASDGLTELVARARSTVETDRPAAVALLRQAAERAGTSQDWPLRQSIFTSLCWWQAPYEPALAEQFIVQQRPLLKAAHEAATDTELVLCQGYVAEQLGERERAGSLYEQAVVGATGLADEPLLESALALRGEWRYVRGDFANALADLQQAFAISSRLGLDDRRRYTLNAIANLYSDQRIGEYDKALEYFQQLRAEHQAAGDRQNIGTSEFNIGATLEAKGDLAGAVPHYHAALAISRELANADDVAGTERALGSVLVKLNRAQEAMPLLDSALASFKASSNPDAMATVLLSRGIAQHALGRSDDALRDLAAAGSYFSSQDNPRYLERVRQEQAAIYREQGRYVESLAMVQQQLQLRERLAEQLKANLTSRLRVQFDTERKEQQNQQLQRENALHEQALLAAQRIRQQQWLIIGLVVLVAVVLAYLFSKQRRQAQRMRAMAMTDELTRLPNRRHVFELLAQQLAALKPAHADYCLLMLDVDHFKQVNDRWGHEVGDKVLQRVAHCLRTVSRPGDAVGRIGGEEFLVLLPGAPQAHAQEVAERLRAAVQALDMQAVASGLQVSISIGLAALSPNDHDGAATIRRADAALYEAKTGGRNRVAVALP